MKDAPSKAQSLFDNSSFLTEAESCFRHDLQRFTPPYYGERVRLRWLENFSKKFLLPGDKLTREDKAIAKFIAVNDEMELLNRSLPHHEPNENLQRLIFWAKEVILAVLGEEVDLDRLLTLSRHSTGSSVGVSYKDTSLEAKWTPPITYAGNARSYLHSLLQNFSELHEGLRSSVGVDMTSYIVGAIAVPGETSELFKRVRGSKATTVPKTNSIDRFICVEPTLNIYFQQGLAELMWEYMEGRTGLRRKSDPEKHRHLAYIGSISNKIATIDFESMSDRVSIAVVNKLFPAQWTAAFMDLRSPYTLVKGKWVENHMISSMGNATTFPIETLVLWSLAVAATFSDRLTYQRDKLQSQYIRTDVKSLVQITKAVGTFGDDVILPTESVQTFLDACTYLGFVPNNDKSFYRRENFRESCGGDFLHGRDVRPLFLRACPSSKSTIVREAWLYTMINRTIQKYITYFGPVAYVYDRALLRLLFRELNKVTRHVKFVPEYFPEDAGVCALRDAWRICRAYRLKISPIWVDKHGSLSFNYLRFSPTRRDDVFEDLRYAYRLKAMVENDRWLIQKDPKRNSYSKLRWLKKSRAVDVERITREFGKYTVARSGFKVTRRLKSSIKTLNLRNVQLETGLSYDSLADDAQDVR